MKTGSVIIALLLSAGLGGCHSKKAVLEESEKGFTTDSIVNKISDEMGIFAQDGETEYEEILLEGERATDSAISYKVRVLKARKKKRQATAYKTQISDSASKTEKKAEKTTCKTEKTRETKTMPSWGELKTIIIAAMILAGVIIIKKKRRKTR